MTAAGGIRSMTGYGTAPIASTGVRGAVSVRAVNHRFLDTSVHLSRRLQAMEGDVKRSVQQRLGRGRVEVSVQAALADEMEPPVVAARPIVGGLVAALRSLQREHGLAGEVTVSDVARFPGAVEVLEAPAEVSEECRAEILTALERALDGVTSMREAEGALLGRELSAAFDRIDAAAGRVEALTDEGKAARREALIEKIRGLCADMGLEDGRVYQEVARVVERHDVAEEVQRLRSHVAQARAAVAGVAACGKRLDFLAQEMAREVNTIGSKAATAAVVHDVVTLKEEIERVREQVQNVE
jgi:uncharacterized protein (TIGR00255 family)